MPMKTVAEICEILQVGEMTVRRWIAQKKLPAVRVGKLVRVPADEFQRFLEAGRIS